MKKPHAPLAAVFAVVLAALALAACRAEEQDRPLTYDKGHYGGPKDEPVNSATLAELRERAMQQAGALLGGTPGSVPTTGTDVRPPKH